MEFSSIKEYFYKLYNACYALTLIPLCIFIFIYLKMQVGQISYLIQVQEWILIAQVLVFLLGLIILTIVHLLVRKKLKVHAKEFSLGKKMDHYFVLSLTRIGSGSFVSACAGGGLFLTGSEIFSVYFLIILLWMAYHWPSPRRLSSELLLKGDEKEMILYKRESF